MTSGQVTETNSPWQYKQNVEREISYVREHSCVSKTKQTHNKVFVLVLCLVLKRTEAYQF